jgi:hypothetical protein
MKRFVLAFVAAYIFIFAWGWLLHGVVLKDVYAEAASLLRPRNEMNSLFHWILLGQALIIFSFIAIYACGFAGGGVSAGVRLGLLMELAAIGFRMAVYATQPFPAKLLILSSVSGLIEMSVVGAIVGGIYKPKATA